MWSEIVLGEVDRTLSMAGPDELGGNPNLEMIRRSREDPDGPTIGASHGRGTIRLFDSGSTERGAPGRNRFRLDDQPREFDPSGDNGAEVARGDVVLLHELGHNVHDSNPEALEELQQVAGWTQPSEDDLAAAGLDGADLQDLHGKKQVRKNGKVYTYNSRTKEYNAVDEDAMPNDGTWSYANTNPRDHFAEQFAKAHVQPATLYKDLCFDPQQQLDAAAAPNTPPETLAKLTATRDKRQAEYDIMRNKVLHTDVAQRAALERIDPARREDFLYEAAQVSTPAQIEQLARKYGRAG